MVCDERTRDGPLALVAFDRQQPISGANSAGPNSITHQHFLIDEHDRAVGPVDASDRGSNSRRSQPSTLGTLTLSSLPWLHGLSSHPAPGSSADPSERNVPSGTRARGLARPSSSTCPSRLSQEPYSPASAPHPRPPQPPPQPHPHPHSQPHLLTGPCSRSEPLPTPPLHSSSTAASATRSGPASSAALSHERHLPSPAASFAAAAAAATTAGFVAGGELGLIRSSSLQELAAALSQLRWLAAGSSGRVYGGLWQGSPVAVKVLLHAGPEQDSAASREALLSRVVSHPAVCQCYTVCSEVITAEHLRLRGADAASRGSPSTRRFHRSSFPEPAAAPAAADPGLAAPAPRARAESATDGGAPAAEQSHGLLSSPFSSCALPSAARRSGGTTAALHDRSSRGSWGFCGLSGAAPSDDYPLVFDRPSCYDRPSVRSSRSSGKAAPAGAVVSSGPDWLTTAASLRPWVQQPSEADCEAAGPGSGLGLPRVRELQPLPSVSAYSSGGGSTSPGQPGFAATAGGIAHGRADATHMNASPPGRNDRRALYGQVRCSVQPCRMQKSSSCSGSQALVHRSAGFARVSNDQALQLGPLGSVGSVGAGPGCDSGPSGGGGSRLLSPAMCSSECLSLALSPGGGAGRDTPRGLLQGGSVHRGGGGTELNTTLSLSELLRTCAHAEDDSGPAALSLPAVLASLGATPGRYATVVVLEYCNQGTLLECIRCRPFCAARTGPNQAGLLALLRTALEVAQGMAYLHSLGIVHGDLKPSNVLLQSHTGSGATHSGGIWEADVRGYVAKVADFGLARPAIGSGPGTSRRLIEAHPADPEGTGGWGALAYLAPEVLVSGPSKRSDVYSYGCVLYHMCTGKQPFHGMRQGQLLAALATGSLRLEWPDGVYKLLRRLGEACCSADPRVRPSFDKLVGALQKTIRHVAMHPCARSAGGGSAVASFAASLPSGGGGQPASKQPAAAEMAAVRRAASEAQSKTDRAMWRSVRPREEWGEHGGVASGQWAPASTAESSSPGPAGPPLFAELLSGAALIR